MHVYAYIHTHIMFVHNIVYNVYYLHVYTIYIYIYIYMHIYIYIYT